MNQKSFFRLHPRSNVSLSGRPVVEIPPPQSSPTHIFVMNLLAALSTTKEFCVTEAGLKSLTGTRFSKSSDLAEFECTSSGSTGSPKVIRRTHLSWAKCFKVNQDRFGLGESDIYAILGQLSHSLSLYGFLEALHIGADTEVLSDLHPSRHLSQLCRSKPTVIYATPSQLRLLLSTQRTKNQATLHSVRYIFCGGGKLDPICHHDMEALCPNARIIEFYGASETSFITITDEQPPEGSVGKAYPGVTIEVRNVKGQPTDGTGEIWVRSPYLFRGYAAGSSIDTRWDGPFLTIGELGQLDQSGNLYLKGRKNRMVTVADINVFPEDIEQVLVADSKVSLCAALPEADSKRGVVIVGVIQGKPDEHLSERLRRSCLSALGTHATPKRFVFVEEFPLLPAGKPDLKALAQMVGLQE